MEIEEFDRRMYMIEDNITAIMEDEGLKFNCASYGVLCCIKRNLTLLKQIWE